MSSNASKKGATRRAASGHPTASRAGAKPSARHTPVNPLYQHKTVIDALKRAYRHDKRLPSVAVGGFLIEEEIPNLRALLTLGWEERHVPDKFRFDARTVVTPEEQEVIKAIQAFAKRVTGKAPVREGTRRFKQGSFTLLHDNVKQKEGVVAYLFAQDWDPAWGGQVVFMKDGETLGSITPQANTLLLAERKKGVRSFVKYVNHKAARSVIVIISP